MMMRDVDPKQLKPGMRVKSDVGYGTIVSVNPKYAYWCVIKMDYEIDNGIEIGCYPELTDIECYMLNGVQLMIEVL